MVTVFNSFLSQVFMFYWYSLCWTREELELYIRFEITWHQNLKEKSTYLFGFLNSTNEAEYLKKTIANPVRMHFEQQLFFRDLAVHLNVLSHWLLR